MILERRGAPPEDVRARIRSAAGRRRRNNGIEQRTDSLPTGRGTAIRRFGRGALGFGAMAGAIFAIACYVSHERDGNVIRAAAVDVVGGAATDADRAIALMRFVHRIPGTKRNEAYFLLPGLRATPLQVLERGGDCADKSRLLAAMLRSVGIPATMGMCFRPSTGRPTHTFVEARPARRERVVLDPAYDMAFPRSGGGFYGLLDLRRDPTILRARIRELRERNSPSHPAHCYDLSSAPYELASTVNWDRGGLASLAAVPLKRWLGEQVYTLPRPRVLEAPKLAVASILATVAALLMVLRTDAVAELLRRILGHTRAGAPAASPSPAG